MKKMLVGVTLLVGSILLTGCTDVKKTEKVLETQGYTKVDAGGYAWFMCSDNDTFATSFKATSPNGTRVSGAVCSGLLKGHTIRFD